MYANIHKLRTNYLTDDKQIKLDAVCYKAKIHSKPAFKGQNTAINITILVVVVKNRLRIK